MVAQAVRVAKMLIATKLRHPSIYARNAAGHQLYRFSHVGAESFLIDALTEYGVRYAAVKGPGGAVLDRGKTENDELEDVVANLYAAVRSLKTPRRAHRTRRAAVCRAPSRTGGWAARSVTSGIRRSTPRSWRCSPSVATRAPPVATRMRCASFVKQGPPLVELTRMILEWQGDNEITRGFLHYALVVGIVAALDARDHDLVRRAHDAASWISDPPLEPEDYARGKAWVSPLEEPELKERLDHVLSGKADQDKRKLHEGVAAARAKGKPTSEDDRRGARSAGRHDRRDAPLARRQDGRDLVQGQPEEAALLRWLRGRRRAVHRARDRATKALLPSSRRRRRSRGAHCGGTPRRRTSAMSCGSAIAC